MSAHGNPTIGLLDGVNTGISVAAGDRLLLQGSILQFLIPQLYQMPVEVVCTLIDTAVGATATINIQTAPDGSTWTTWYSFAFTALSGLSGAKHRVGSIAVPYVRANVTVLTGTAPVVKCYLRMNM